MTTRDFWNKVSKSIAMVVLALSLTLAAASPAAGQETLHVAAGGLVGIGTSTPGQELHIVTTAVQDNNASVFLDATPTGGIRWQLRAQGNDQFHFRDDTNKTIPLRIRAGAKSSLLQLGMNGLDRVDITGSLFINGIDNTTPDYVFDPDFELESIEEHAALMWENKHLPALAPGQIGEDGKAVIDVANRSQGVLEELEKAHIYIEQLNAAIQHMQTRLGQLEARDCTMATTSPRDDE